MKRPSHPLPPFVLLLEKLVQAGDTKMKEEEDKNQKETKQLHMGTQVNAWTTHGQLAWTTCTASYQSWTVRLSCNCSQSSTTSISTAWTPLYVKLVMNRCHSVYSAVGFQQKLCGNDGTICGKGKDKFEFDKALQAMAPELREAAKTLLLCLKNDS